MKIILGDRLRTALGIDDPGHLSDVTLDPQQVDALRYRIEQAMAARCPEDTGFPDRLVWSDTRKRRWRVRLNVTLKFPTPVDLSFEVTDEHTWKLDLVTTSA